MNTTRRFYPASEHVELQIYGAGFFSDSDRDLCRQFHSRSWEERLRLVEQFDDQRLRRLGRRLVYFEAPHLIEETERRAMDVDIGARRRGDTLGWKRVSDVPIPFDLKSARLFYIDNDEDGLDFGVIAIELHHVGLLAKNGVIALTEERWNQQHTASCALPGVIPLAAASGPSL
jgi:hypothetical protein